jgi:hypothetical protein
MPTHREGVRSEYDVFTRKYIAKWKPDHNK